MYMIAWREKKIKTIWFVVVIFCVQLSIKCFTRACHISYRLQFTTNYNHFFYTQTKIHKWMHRFNIFPIDFGDFILGCINIAKITGFKKRLNCLNVYVDEITPSLAQKIALPPYKFWKIFTAPAQILRLRFKNELSWKP